MQLGFPAMTTFGELYVWAWECPYLQPPSTQAMATALFCCQGPCFLKEMSIMKMTLHMSFPLRCFRSQKHNTGWEACPWNMQRQERDPNLPGGVTAHNSKSKGWSAAGLTARQVYESWTACSTGSDERHQFDLGWQNHSMQCTCSLYPPRPQILAVLRTQLRKLKTRDCSASLGKVQALLIMV